MGEVVKWVLENYFVVLSGIAGLLAALMIFAKLTKTPKDDEALEAASGIVQKIIDFLKPKK